MPRYTSATGVLPGRLELQHNPPRSCPRMISEIDFFHELVPPFTLSSAGQVLATPSMLQVLGTAFGLSAFEQVDLWI